MPSAIPALATQTPAAPSSWESLQNQAHRIAGRALAPNTQRAYAADWADFSTWCSSQQVACLPADPETVILYMTDLAGRSKTSTLTRRVAAISHAHQVSGLESPTHRSPVRLFLRALRREKAAQGDVERGKRAILSNEMQAVLRTIPVQTIQGIRDRALLLVGYLGAFRRSELVSLDVAHVGRDEAGIVIHLHRSKTDPEGKGLKKGIPKGNPAAGTCAVAALEQWLQRSGITEGPIFRPVNARGGVEPRRLSDRAVARTVKRYAAAAHLNPEEVSGHSLRSGLATAAAAAGKSERSIMNQTGHRSVVSVRRYIRDGNLFRDNAAAELFVPGGTGHPG